MVWWLPVALVAPAFYAFEGNFVARYGTEGLDPCRSCSAPAWLEQALPRRSRS
jgi:hypothetical protein